MLNWIYTKTKRGTCFIDTDKSDSVDATMVSSKIPSWYLKLVSGSLCYLQFVVMSEFISHCLLRSSHLGSQWQYGEEVFPAGRYRGDKKELI